MKRTDLESILVIGSGPIVIGQACEFDYSGTQACKALREEGYRVVLVNSNPATIMTDPETADRTYVEPMTVESITKIIEAEKPDALLPTIGGQTALNLAVELAESGGLERHGVRLIGAQLDAILEAEDRERPLFSVQYHPEASPGPHDAGYFFGRFREMVARHKAGETVSGAQVASGTGSRVGSDGGGR